MPSSRTYSPLVCSFTSSFVSLFLSKHWTVIVTVFDRQPIISVFNRHFNSLCCSQLELEATDCAPNHLQPTQPNHADALHGSPTHVPRLQTPLHRRGRQHYPWKYSGQQLFKQGITFPSSAADAVHLRRDRAENREQPRREVHQSSVHAFVLCDDNTTMRAVQNWTTALQMLKKSKKNMSYLVC